MTWRLREKRNWRAIRSTLSAVGTGRRLLGSGVDGSIQNQRRSKVATNTVIVGCIGIPHARRVS